MQENLKTETKIIIIKDTIIFNQKDSLYIQSNDLKELKTYVSEIQYDIKEHFNKKEDTFLGASYDTAFTVIITILIFALGLIIDRIIKYNQDKNELKKIKDYFNNLFNDLKNNLVPNLIEVYKKNYQEIISLNNGMPTTPPKILTNTYDRLSNLESPLLFKTFKNSSDFNIAFSQIDLIKKLMFEVDQYHSHSLDRSSSLRNIIAELDSKYINKLVEYTEFEKKNNPNYLNNPTFQLINGKIVYYHQNITGKRNLTEYYKEIIRPIQFHIVKTNLFRTDNICNQIAEYGKQFSHKFNELKRLSIEIRLQYREFAKILNESKISLNKLNTE